MSPKAKDELIFLRDVFGGIFSDVFSAGIAVRRASLMPKELQIANPLDEISDEQLDAAIVAVRAILAAQDPGRRKVGTGEKKSAESVPAIPKAG